MTEETAVTKSKRPLTNQDLLVGWQELGLRSGMCVLVHASLSSLGWVCGGAVTVIRSLMEVLSAQGTLVMPAHSSDNSEPSYWRNPAIPREWWPTVRDTLPPFDPRWTPTRGMGAVAELFRSLPEVRRSNHPTSSFCAWGKGAKEIVGQHSLHHPFGEQTPLAALYERGAKILLIGTDWSVNTSLHLAEERAGGYGEINQASAIMENGKRRWIGFAELESDLDLFPPIGVAFESQPGAVKRASVGLADCRLMDQKNLVDFAVAWIRKSAERS